MIARFFLDLRSALRVTPHHIAAQLMTGLETIDALETGRVWMLPQWPETARVVMAYTALAGIDGRPVLQAIADLHHAVAAVRTVPVPAAADRTQNHQIQHVERIRRAGTAFANGAKRLPRDAMQQVRERPQRALYAISVPLFIVMLLLNTSVVQGALGHLPRPVVRLAHSVQAAMQDSLAPVREGHRWIEAEDPRQRRADKLRIGPR
jgi:type VI protein secretion system component VasF